MKQLWIFSVRYAHEGACTRIAVVGPAGIATVEAALKLSPLRVETAAQIRADSTVRRFVEGKLDPGNGAYVHSREWDVSIGSVHAVIP